MKLKMLLKKRGMESPPLKIETGNPISKNPFSETGRPMAVSSESVRFARDLYRRMDPSLAPYPNLKATILAMLAELQRRLDAQLDVPTPTEGTLNTEVDPLLKEPGDVEMVPDFIAAENE